MPRNGSGTASIVNTFTPLTTADANDVNENFTDIATMITDSLPRDGQAGMSGPLLAISGTATEPGIAFNADTNTGFRRPSGDTVAAVCGGSDVATFDSTGVSVSIAPATGNNLANKTYVDSIAPPGSVTMFAASTAPTGWLECSGAAVSRTTYASLFAAIGTTFGAGDGSTTFNLPNLRGEFVRGWDNGRGVDTGRVFGSAQADEVKSHTHTGTTNSDGAHTHTYLRGLGGSGLGAEPGTDGASSGTTSSSGAHTHTFTTAATGGAETRSRNIALLYIIKT